MSRGLLCWDPQDRYGELYCHYCGTGPLEIVDWDDYDNQDNPDKVRRYRATTIVHRLPNSGALHGTAPASTVPN